MTRLVLCAAVALGCASRLTPPACASPPTAADPFEQGTLDGVAKLGGKAAPDDRLEADARVGATFDKVTDADLVALAKLPSLGALTVSDASAATEKGFAALRELPNLQKLVLGKSNLTDKSAAAVGTVRTLQVLYVGDSKLTDDGLAGFKRLKHLKALDLYQARVTDRGLAHLSGLTALEELNLSGTKVTDACVAPLKGLTALKLLRVAQTGVTRAGVTKLEEALPKATVRF